MYQPGEVEESKVVENLLQSSVEFRKFYDNARPKAGKIKWCYYPNLHEQYAADAAHVTDINGEHQKICLARFPVYVEDAHIVAHEIMHAICSEENNTLIIYEHPNPNPALSPYIASMLDDPNIESLLYKIYKFDLLSDLLAWISSIKNAHEKWRQDDNPHWQLASAFNLANKMMCWKLIKDPKKLRIWDEFLIWYSHPTKCPDVVSKSKDLAAIMERTGLRTLDQRASVFSYVVEKYQLNRYISLKNKFGANPRQSLDDCPRGSTKKILYPQR
jgi:hypothetical protein